MALSFMLSIDEYWYQYYNLISKSGYLDLCKSNMMPKLLIIEKALSIYLAQINKAEYIKSYKAAANDKEIMDIAEEGMIDF